MGFNTVLGTIVVILLICHQQFFTSAAAVIKKRKVGNLINDGKEAATNQFPWQVMVQSNLSSGGERFCGGAIISSKWILTAGHCINGANNITLRLGSNDWSTSEIHLSSNQFIIHPEFKYRSAYHNDIGLIQVENLTFSENIQAIHLPAKDQMGVSFVGVKGRFQGWGSSSSENGTQPGINLKWMDTIVIKNSECASDYGSIVTDSVICSRGGGICGSDFGGPLSVKEKEGWVLIGIASFTQGCDYEKPIGFTRVTSHLNWISEQTGIEIVY